MAAVQILDVESWIRVADQHRPQDFEEAFAYDVGSNLIEASS